ncbi:DUF3261 domain-containing protein [Thalassotalea marina]|uniref:DUF3261 domain-containing protein n=1 Tax=Thalassotalea marina TaxID=1673741 RepID=A0A919BM88_9GAMM|nr:DUF3261 domain-containing protein [Thalassotalea marina]GHF97107.1 hypothetical protein GCM10017161_26530 [Thalassotalea marina]
MQKWLSLVFFMGLMGCSVTLPAGQVTLSPGVNWPLQVLTQNNTFADTQVLVTGQFAQQSHQMLVTTEVNHNKFVMVGVSLQGVPLFELTQSATGEISTKRYIPIPMKAEYVLADMQVIHLPLNDVQSQLVGARLVEEIENGDRYRRIYHQDTLVIEVRYTEQLIHFSHKTRGYQLSIKNLRQNS